MFGPRHEKLLKKYLKCKLRGEKVSKNRVHIYGLNGLIPLLLPNFVMFCVKLAICSKCMHSDSTSYWWRRVAEMSIVTVQPMPLKNPPCRLRGTEKVTPVAGNPYPECIATSSCDFSCSWPLFRKKIEFFAQTTLRTTGKSALRKGSDS